MTQFTTPAPAGGAASRTLGDWAREVAPIPPAAPTPPGGRRTALGLAAAMIANPLAMTAWFLVEPSVLPREEPAVFLRSVASSPDRYLVATVLVTLAGVLAVPAAVGVARVLRRRLPRLGAVVGVLMFLSGLGLCAQIGFRGFVWSLVEQGSVPAASVESYAAFQTGGFFDVLVAPGLVFGALATLLTIGCLVRTRLVPLWVPAALLASTVLASGEFADPVTVAGAATGVLANLRLVKVLLA